MRYSAGRRTAARCSDATQSEAVGRTVSRRWPGERPSQCRQAPPWTGRCKSVDHGKGLSE